MELTYVAVHGTNAGPPPRLSKPISLPLNQLWTQGVLPNTRQQILQILSRAAGKSIQVVATPLTKPLEPREVSDE
jgi:hypothetical protein